MLTIVRLRLAAHSQYPLQLGLTVLLWQASTGVYVLSLAQRYLPDELGAGVAYPGYAMALYAAGGVPGSFLERTEGALSLYAHVAASGLLSDDRPAEVQPLASALIER